MFYRRKLAVRFGAASFVPRIGRVLAACTLAALVCSTANAQIYSNVDISNLNGYIIANNGATASDLMTYVVAELIQCKDGSAGQNVASVEFTLANSAVTTAVTANADVYVWDTTGPSGGPGNLLAALGGTAISIKAGLYGYTNTGGPLFNVPANNEFWVGEAYSASGTTTTAAKLNTVGQLTFDPPTVGASPDELWENTTIPAGGNLDSYFVNDPTGAISTSPFGGAPIANFGYAFSTPAPSDLTVFALGAAPMLALLRRKRRASRR